MNSLSFSVAQKEIVSQFISEFSTLPYLVCHRPVHLHFDLDISVENRRRGGKWNEPQNRLRKRSIRDLCVSGHPGLWWKWPPSPELSVTQWSWVHPIFLSACHILGTLYKLPFLAVIPAFRKRPHFAHFTEKRSRNYGSCWHILQCGDCTEVAHTCAEMGLGRCLSDLTDYHRKTQFLKQ